MCALKYSGIRVLSLWSPQNYVNYFQQLRKAKDASYNITVNNITIYKSFFINILIFISSTQV